MHSATAVSYYRGSKDYRTLTAQRGPPEDPYAQTETIKITEAETWLVSDWAGKVLDSKNFRFVSMAPWGWTIFLPEREVQTTPLVKKGAPCHKNESRTGRN